MFNILPSKNNYYNGYFPFSTTSLAYLLNINITKTIINEDNKPSIIQDKNIIEKIFNSLTFDNDELKEFFKQLMVVLNNYIDKRIGVVNAW